MIWGTATVSVGSLLAFPGSAWQLYTAVDGPLRASAFFTLQSTPYLFSR